VRKGITFLNVETLYHVQDTLEDYFEI